MRLPICGHGTGVAAFALVFTAACATLSPKVRLERVRADTDFLKFRHDVEERCTLLGRETLSDEGGPNTRRKVRIFAASTWRDRR